MINPAISPLGIIFHFVYIKPKRILTMSFLLEVLRGVWPNSFINPTSPVNPIEAREPFETVQTLQTFNLVEGLDMLKPQTLYPKPA